jgi:hypothetical protein
MLHYLRQSCHGLHAGVTGIQLESRHWRHHNARRGGACPWHRHTLQCRHSQTATTVQCTQQRGIGRRRLLAVRDHRHLSSGSTAIVPVPATFVTRRISMLTAHAQSCCAHCTSVPRASPRSRVYHPNMPDVARTYCAHSRPIPIRDQCQLQVGWARLARAMRLAPTLHFSRSNARGRSDLHSPHDAWTSQTHASPGMLPDRRGMSAAYSRFRQNGDSRLAATCRSAFCDQIDGIGWPRAKVLIHRDPRDYARVPRAG